MKFIVLSIYMLQTRCLIEKLFFTTTKSWVKKFALNENNMLMVGDFNCKLDEQTHCFDTSTHHFKSITKQFHFIDTWKKLNLDLHGAMHNIHQVVE